MIADHVDNFWFEGYKVPFGKCIFYTQGNTLIVKERNRQDFEFVEWETNMTKDFPSPVVDVLDDGKKVLLANGETMATEFKMKYEY